MSDPGDTFALLFHPLDILVGGSLVVDGGLEAPGCVIDSATEAGADGEKARDERRDEVLAGARGDDRVVRSGDAGADCLMGFFCFVFGCVVL